MTEELEFSYELRIPEERIAVLIGTEGKTKKEIEEATHSTLMITKDGEVTITGNEALELYTTREIVRAIARGFNPKVALHLLKSDYLLEIIDLSDVVGKNKNMLERLKGRLIGTKGKAQREIQRLAEVSIAIYGKTIGIIGMVEQVQTARQAIEMVIRGSMHKTVYQFLEKKKKEMMAGSFQ